MRPRIPAPFLLAAFSPTLVLGLLLVVDALGGPAFPFGPFAAFALWLLATLPAALVAWGSRQLTGNGSDEPVRAALEAVGRAEKLLAQQAELLERSEPRPAAAPAARRLLAPALAVLLVGAALGAGAFWLGSEGPALLAAPDPVHLHATFAVYGGSERIPFTDPAFDLGERGFLRGHLHVPDQDVAHIEGAPGLTFGEFLASGLGVTFHGGSLVLDDAVHGGRALAANATHSWRLLVAHDGGDAWTEVPEGASYVPRDRDRLLLALATPDDPLTAQKASVGRTFPAPM